MKKLLLIICLAVAAALSLTACGSDPVVKTAQTGIRLEDKARDLTGQQQDESENADDMVEQPGE